MDEDVESYSGVEFAERPVSFTWQGERRTVKQVLSEARMPAGKRFEIVDVKHESFLLSYDSLTDRWRVRPLEKK
jgi:hypothetical protein